MLAALGWATSELIHPSLSRLFGAGSLLSPAASGALTKAPSVLNGGLERVSYGLWVAGFVLAAVLEFPRMLDIAENPVRLSVSLPLPLALNPLALDRHLSTAISLPPSLYRLPLFSLLAYADSLTHSITHSMCIPLTRAHTHTEPLQAGVAGLRPAQILRAGGRRRAGVSRGERVREKRENKKERYFISLKR
jgi:hypothetical protein